MPVHGDVHWRGQISRVLRPVMVATLGTLGGFIVGAIVGSVVSYWLYPQSPDPGPVDALDSIFFTVESAAVGAVVGLAIVIWMPRILSRRRARRSGEHE